MVVKAGDNVRSHINYAALLIKAKKNSVDIVDKKQWISGPLAWSALRGPCLWLSASTCNEGYQVTLSYQGLGVSAYLLPGTVLGYAGF